MTRNTPQALLNLLDDPEVKPFYAVEMNFTSAPVRFWTGYGDRTINGDTYLGTGNLLSITGLDEVNDLSAKSITLQLSGVPASLVSLALVQSQLALKIRLPCGGRHLALSGLSAKHRSACRWLRLLSWPQAIMDLPKRMAICWAL